MSNVIRSFSGDYGFLSNFHRSPIQFHLRFEGWDRWERRIPTLTYPTAEHLYQAWKTDDRHWHEHIAGAATAREAKQLGQQSPLRKRWEREKFEVMHAVVNAKFRQNPTLAQQLVDTGNALLVEGNTWHDQTWGDCVCAEHAGTPGRNALGIILMRVRLDWQAGLTPRHVEC
jgi:ribA/ribD-fused uncharacterized protein